jgi:hypothetical protein
MCNCNQKRAAFKQVPDAYYRNMIKMRLQNEDQVVVNGSITGRTYIFKTKGDINWVDKRDLNDFSNHQNIITL